MFKQIKKENNRTERIVMRLSKKEKILITEHCRKKNITISRYLYNLVCIDIAKYKS